MAIQRSTVVDALDANLNELFQDGLTDHGGEYEKVFNMESSDKQSEADSYESGFTSMPEKDEGVAATYDTVIAGIKKVYTHKTYALNILDVLRSNLEVIKRAISVEALTFAG